MNLLSSFPRCLTRSVAGGLLCLVLLLVGAPPAGAAGSSPGEVAAAPALPPLAAWYSELARRDRVVQVCVVVGAIALFVIMKKLVR
jgi:hypothetical protein